MTCHKTTSELAKVFRVVIVLKNCVCKIFRKQRESFKLENAIKEQEKKKMSYDEQKKKCGQLMAVLRFAIETC